MYVEDCWGHKKGGKCMLSIVHLFCYISEALTLFKAENIELIPQKL